MIPDSKLPEPEVGLVRSFSIPSLTRSEPEFGELLPIAPDIYWSRLPMSGARESVNIYFLTDNGETVLIDTGCNLPASLSALKTILQSDLVRANPVRRVICTHYHPDHIGLAGFFDASKVELNVSRTCWLYSHLLRHENNVYPGAEQIEFMRRAGLDGIELEVYSRRPSNNYANLVLPIPPTYRRLKDSDILEIGERTWQVRLLNGHAAEQATLWSNDGLVIVGDQVLPNIAANVNVHYSEPAADPLQEWIESCHRIIEIATDEILCLPGHNRPFYGLPARCRQQLGSCEEILKRLLSSLDRPRSAFECLELIYRRNWSPFEKYRLIGEAMGFLNHLKSHGKVTTKFSNRDVCSWIRQSN